MLKNLTEHFSLVFFPILEDVLHLDQVRLKASHMPRIVILRDVLLAELGQHFMDVYLGFVLAIVDIEGLECFVGFDHFVTKCELVEEIFHKLNAFFLRMLDHVNIFARLAEVNVEENGHAFVLLECQDRIELPVGNLRIFVPQKCQQGSVPVFLVIGVLLAHHYFRFLFCHCLRVLAFEVWINELLIDAFLDKVRLQRVMIDAIGDGFLHSDWLPVSEGAIDVRSTVVIARFYWPVRPQFINLSIVMLQDLGVLLSRQMSDPWCPHKDSHDIIAADPALIFLVRVDTPLRDTLDELLVTQVPLND